MRSPPIGALLAGALLAATAAPAAAGPPGPPDIDNGAGGTQTVVTVYVDAGTTLYVPAAVTINLNATNNAWPGQTVNNLKPLLANNAKAEWWSNEAEKHIHAGMGDLRGQNVEQTIADGDVHLFTVAPDGTTPANSGAVTDKGSFEGLTPTLVSGIDEVSTGTVTTMDHEYFYLEVTVPSATEDTYTSFLVWTVS